MLDTDAVKSIEFALSLMRGKVELSTWADIHYRFQFMCDCDDGAWHIGIFNFEQVSLPLGICEPAMAVFSGDSDKVVRNL